MAYSILIKNGTIADGSGKKPFRGDIGIVDDKIEKIGNLKSASAKEVIDAENLYVTPGFIDLTSHSDIYWTLFSSPGQESLLTQGVTTILVGNCGESLAPIFKTKSFEALEKWATTPSINADWTSVKEYLNSLSKLELGVNVATLVGHDTLRRASKNNADLLRLLNQSLKEGAWGLSSNFSFLEWSNELDKEAFTLLEEVREQNMLYKVHLRDEGKDFLPAIASVLNLIRRAGTKTVISHFKGIGRSAWKDFGKALAMIKNSREDRVPIYLDTFPYLRTGSMLVSLLPQWARTGESDEILKKLVDPAIKEKVINELKKLTLHPDRIMIAAALHDKSSIGKTLDKISELYGLSPEETIVEILKINNLSVSIFGKTVHQKHLLNTVQQEECTIATDGAGYSLESKESGNLAHPRSFGTYARYFNKIAPLAGIPIEKAVLQASALPASLMGLKDRGTLKEKFIADICVFHPEEFKDTSTYHEPYSYSIGMRHVLVNGEVAVSNVHVVDDKFGKVLKKT